ncbi:7514_t:CDS:2 [Ambispora leptoticha]|uniref:7514_t:CDS:1 n=1 Tax=Ambispora leptoticha TaxID=144679 RepID=A0A9N9GDM8_9GLOM|nr:7514_t:CDS:2 [Ambispora leptoticha]
MIHTPSYRELQRIFESEAQAIEYLQEKEVLSKQMKCPKCNQSMTLNNTVFDCVKRACRKRMSIFTNTIFYGANTPYNRVLEIGYLWIIEMKHKSIKTFTGMSPTTITRWLKIFKELVSFNLEEEHQQIGGQDIIVEIDESKFGTRVERTPQQKMFAMIVEDRSADTLLKQIEKHIHPESVIYSDMWKGYQNIYSWLGIQHHAINHSQGFTMKDTNPVTGEIQVYHTNTIEAHWQVIKSKIPPRECRYLFTELLVFIWKRQNPHDQFEALIRCLRRTAKISDLTNNTDIIEEMKTSDNDQTRSH